MKTSPPPLDQPQCAPPIPAPIRSDWGLEVAEPGHWYEHKVHLMPDALGAMTIVEVRLRNGVIGRDEARRIRWYFDTASPSADVIEWRVIPDDEVPPATKPYNPSLVGQVINRIFDEPTSPPGAGAPSKRYDENCRAIGHKHSHYHKSVAHLDSIDVYRVLALFNVTDPCLQHAVKKLLVAGGRGAGKDAAKDVQEAIDSLTRWQEMRTEDAGVTV